MSAITIETVLSAVEATSGLARREILSDRRSEQETVARYTVWWLARRFTGLSNAEIGRATNRDTASVHHGLHRIAELRAANPGFRSTTDVLVASLTAIERGGFSLAPQIDPIAVATRVVANPEREAVRISAAETTAIARELLALHFADKTHPETVSNG